MDWFTCGIIPSVPVCWFTKSKNFPVKYTIRVQIIDRLYKQSVVFRFAMLITISS